MGDFRFCLQLVCQKDNEQIKYCMTILYKDSDNPEFTDNVLVDSYMDINVNVRPEFVYYDNHCIESDLNC